MQSEARMREQLHLSAKFANAVWREVNQDAPDELKLRIAYRLLSIVDTLRWQLSDDPRSLPEWLGDEGNGLFEFVESHGPQFTN